MRLASGPRAVSQGLHGQGAGGLHRDFPDLHLKNSKRSELRGHQTSLGGSQSSSCARGSLMAAAPRSAVGPRAVGRRAVGHSAVEKAHRSHC
ncbi:hypothetical protein NDU88_012539 [Pleurodeles waltl]|uniref:Uncharacterized protein n=1 Tax=Pleurodeles waltl TaxID=8319 RepID=A0AAV7R4T2_PLEWA|nr:hypothetical protein NDU88_012539 [Pleurodeles waltl]